MKGVEGIQDIQVGLHMATLERNTVMNLLIHLIDMAISLHTLLTFQRASTIVQTYPPHRCPPEYNPGPPPGASEAYYDRASYDYYAGREPGAEYYYSYPPHHQYAKGDEVHPLMRDQYSDRDRRGNQEGLAPAGRAQIMSKTSTPQRKKVKGDDSVKTASSFHLLQKTNPAQRHKLQ